MEIRRLGDNSLSKVIALLSQGPEFDPQCPHLKANKADVGGV